jgi:hypothetical protein
VWERQAAQGLPLVEQAERVRLREVQRIPPELAWWLGVEPIALVHPLVWLALREAQRVPPELAWWLGVAQAVRIALALPEQAERVRLREVQRIPPELAWWLGVAQVEPRALAVSLGP